MIKWPEKKKKKKIVSWLLSFPIKWNQFSMVMERNVFLESIKGLSTSPPCHWQLSKGCLSGCLTSTTKLANFVSSCCYKVQKRRLGFKLSPRSPRLTYLKKQIVRGPMRNHISVIWIPFLLPKLWSDAVQEVAEAAESVVCSCAGWAAGLNQADDQLVKANSTGANSFEPGCCSKWNEGVFGLCPKLNEA